MVNLETDRGSTAGAEERVKSPMIEYYQNNFIVKDKDGKPRMTIDTSLLPSSSNKETKETSRTVIETTGDN